MSTTNESSIHSSQITETDSDKDLIIHSLNESLQIHKEILERIQNEKDTFQQQAAKELQEQRESFEQWKLEAQDASEEEKLRCVELQENIATLKAEIEKKKKPMSN
ncbi:hypothetical protein G6F62_006090 [Rhizopus arrhizus]|nr:hypothetical protein G6F62_006090 [Rhizopus arrhizus]